MMIEVKNLGKTFIKYEKEAGLWGLLKVFFNAKKIEVHAVEDISFTIKRVRLWDTLGPMVQGSRPPSKC